ncbi:MAG: DHHW family protein [Myxococcota bacterium]|nr:DHHW family protein [Myxococcota bacterium]
MLVLLVWCMAAPGALSAQPEAPGTEPSVAQVFRPPTRSKVAPRPEGRLERWYARRAHEYAGVINDFYDRVDERRRVFSVVAPTSRAIAGVPTNNRSARIVALHIDTMDAALRPGVHAVDPFDVMGEHAHEYLYFRTDHHWTALGAYYAYRALCEEAGIAPLPLHRFEKRAGTRRFLGSLYRRNRSPAMRRRADSVDYYVPPVDHTAVRYSRARPNRAVDSSFLLERRSGYRVFLGGDYPLIVGKTDVKNGKRVMLVKNSYGNPFAVYLLSHYEEVYVVDYRHQKRSLLELVDTYDIDDVVFLNVASLSASRSHHRRLRKLIRGHR